MSNQNEEKYTQNTQYWKGTWKSSQSDLITGDVYAKTDQKGDTELATILLTYTGLYMTGLCRVFDFEVVQEILENEMQLTSSNQNRQRACSYKFCGAQDISMKATTKTEQKISGTYNTFNPRDDGEFWLNRVTSVELKDIAFENQPPHQTCIVS